MQSIGRLLVVILIIAGGWGLSRLWVKPQLAEGQAPSAAVVNTPLFAATLPDATGQQQAIKQWQGKILVVNFWATWCGPCREEMPELSKLHDTYKDKNVMVIGISTDNLAKVVDFAKKSPVSYPLLAGDMEIMTLSEQLGNDKGALPYTVIVKPDGTIAKTYFGRVSQPLLEETLLPLIKATD